MHRSSRADNSVVNVGGKAVRMRRAWALTISTLLAMTMIAGSSPVRAASTTAVAAGPVAHAPAIPGATLFSGHVPAYTRQVIVVTAQTWRSTTATLRLYRSDGIRWFLVRSLPARLGYGGLVKASQRQQGTGTTPAGLFAITEAFGRKANPGTALPYAKLTADDWWVEDRESAYYNQKRLGSQGGFTLATQGFNSSEHLAGVGAPYDYVAVIDFNRTHPVVGRGAGIFLHVNGAGSTAGCVSLPAPAMLDLLRWLDPTAHPRIIIGPSNWLKQPAQ